MIFGNSQWMQRREVYMKRAWLRFFSTLLSSVLLLTMVPAASFTGAAASQVEILHLRTDYLENPMGLDSTKPVFSWELSSSVRGFLQTAYQVIVRQGGETGEIVWDSGKVSDGRSNNIEYAGTALKSQTVYVWSVRIWDNQGGETVSDTATFETGLLTTEDWSGAKWLKYDPGSTEAASEGNVHYTYEMDFRITHDNFGVIFAAQDSSNFFMWAVNTTGTAPALRRHICSGGSWLYVEDVTLPAQFTKESLLNATHHLKITVEGSTVTTQMDDLTIDTYTDTYGALVEGLFGFRVHNEGGLVDNVKAVSYQGETETVRLDLDFEDGVNPFTGGTITEDSGSKKLLVQDSNEIRVLEQTEPAERNLNYTYEMDFQIVRDNVGVVFSAKDTSTFYLWAINTTGANQPYLRRHIFSGGSNVYSQDIPLPTQFTKDSLLTQEHHLSIQVQGNLILTFLDDVRVDIFFNSSDALIEGYFGFRFYNEGGRFDNVKAVRYQDGMEKVLLDADFETGINPFSSGDIVEVDGNKKLEIVTSSELKVLENRTSAASMFRKDFTVEQQQVASARVYYSALGVSDLYLNGVRVGRQTGNTTTYDELKPGWTDYDDTVFYLTYDVTHLIQAGENAIGAEVASGWYNGIIAQRGGSAYSKTANGLMIKLDITYADGSHQILVTDNSWQSSKDGAVTYADIYNGEIYDATRDGIETWSQAGFDASDWVAAATKTDFRGVVMAAIGTTVQSREELSRTPVTITKYQGVQDNGSTYGEIANVENPTFPFPLKAGETVIFDLGQNITGWERFTAKGAEGTVVNIHFGEMLNDSGEASRKNDGPKGSVYNANYLEAKASGQYIMRGDAAGETYNPRFTFYGFRYVEITATADIEITDLKGIVVGNANEENSTLVCSDDSVNQLYSNIQWGQRCNFLSTATDCPQRNERLGWTADTHIFSRTATYNSDVVSFYRKWLQDMRDSQFGPEAGNLEGGYPDVAPNTHIVGGGNGGWAEAGIIVPWNVYLMYGDTQLIREHFESMEKYMDMMARQGDDQWKYNGGGAASGDWVSPELNDDNVKRYVSVTYYAYSAQLMTKMAAAIGSTEAQAKYAQLSEDIKAEFNLRYVNEDGTLNVATQTTYLLALKLDLFATEEQRNHALETLLQKIKDNGNRLSTGFIGTSILNQTLSEVGASDMAYTLLLQHDYPSWLYSVDQGATTIWENWDSYTIENGFKDPGMNSFNHYAYGAVGEWMYRYMAGIEADESQPGFQHFILQPTPDLRSGEDLPEGQTNITWVDCTYDSIYGDVGSKWQTGEDGRMTLTVTVPTNTTATLYLPLVTEEDAVLLDGTLLSDRTGVIVQGVEDCKAVVELGSGTYTFQVLAEAPEVLLGDMNQDGTLSVTDVVLLRKSILANNFDPIGDMNQDSNLSVTDVVLLRKNILNQN